MVGVAFATALAVGLGAPGAVFARGRWENVIAPASRGRARPAPAPSDNGGMEKVRVSARASTPASYSYREDRDSSASDSPRVSSRMLEHAAGDRLREALAAAQDDPKSAARISRLIAQAAAEARRNKALADRVWYWRDPFSANPRRPIVLSMEAQLEMQVAAARLEVARARVESNAARVEAATAHVEAARARLDAARAQGAAGRNGSVAARHDSRLARPSDDDDAPARNARRPASTAPASAPGESRAGDPIRVRRRALAPRSLGSSSPETALARNEGVGARAASRHRDIGAARSPATAGGAPEAPAADPTSLRSRDPRGIVVVPINTPVAALPTKPAARR